MAAGKSSRTIHAGGRIVIGPTSLSGSIPFGGTEVGRTTLVVLQPLGVPYRVFSEGLGEAGDILEPPNHFVCAFFARGWDNDAVQKFFSGGYAAGGTTKHAVWSIPGSTPGTSSLGRAVIMLFVPDDTIHVPALLVYRGVPHWVEGAEVSFQAREELGLPIVLDCIRDGNANTLAIGRLADLSLT